MLAHAQDAAHARYLAGLVAWQPGELRDANGI